MYTLWPMVKKKCSHPLSGSVTKIQLQNNFTFSQIILCFIASFDKLILSRWCNTEDSCHKCNNLIMGSVLGKDQQQNHRKIKKTVSTPSAPSRVWYHEIEISEWSSGALVHCVGLFGANHVHSGRFESELNYSSVGLNYSSVGYCKR
ncbi:hypothetical protein Btru_073753 [Bulinus truncatus]|nr:hypothetical protein Btru_073753 [Bulinus truncatus]